jgi:hypothetical protein
VTEPASPPTKPARSLTGFYLALGAVAALVALGVWLMPVAQFQYHSWKHRTAQDPNGKSLAWLADCSVRRHLDRAAIKRLLGEPVQERPDCLLYRLNPCPLDSAPLMGYWILLDNDRASEVQPWAGVGIRIGP